MNKKVAVIGLGYVGLPLSLLISKKGNDVIGIDIDQEKLDKIKNKTSPFVDKKVSDDLQSTKIKTSNNFAEIIDREVIIVCVPTPVKKDKSPDYSHIVSACENIGRYLGRNQLVVIESTINPGTTEEIIIPILEKESGLSAGLDFYVAHVPERLNPGDEVWNIGNIDRVVGGLNSESLKMASAFYRSILDAKVFELENIKESEAVKIVENCFRDVNIAFVNEMAKSFSKMGINISNVIKGASTKPFEFMAHYPGCGVGGHCIPVDPYYLINHSLNNGFDHELLMTARSINNSMPKYTAQLLKDALTEAGLEKNQIKVCILGLTYKANIQDTRESPSYEILKLLKNDSINVSTHDPFITNDTMEDVLTDVQAVIIATAHNEYIDLDPDYFIHKGIKIIIDGRNCLDYKRFNNSKLIYKGIGC